MKGVGDSYMVHPRGQPGRNMGAPPTRRARIPFRGAAMSDYFTEDYQGVGAIAAAAPAPRSAPAPMMRTRRRGMGAINDPGPGEGMPGSNTGSGGGGPGGPTFPGRTFTRTKVPTSSRPPKPPPAPPGRPPVPGQRPIVPGYLPPRVLTVKQPLTLTAVTQPIGTLGPKPVVTSIKTETAYGGGGQGGAWSGGGGGGGELDEMAPDEGTPVVGQSASPSFLPSGAAKAWLIGGAAAGVGYLLYRHFKKRRGRR